MGFQVTVLPKIFHNCIAQLRGGASGLAWPGIDLICM
jgi:hypothetical protein